MKNQKKTTEQFDNELKMLNPHLVCVSPYLGANTTISIRCTRCGNTMSHKTPHGWLCDSVRARRKEPFRAHRKKPIIAQQ